MLLRLPRLIVASLVIFLLHACGEPNQTTEPDAQTVHREALTIDAHADIEIPGQPWVTLARMVCPKSRRIKCAQEVWTRW